MEEIKEALILRDALELAATRIFLKEKSAKLQRTKQFVCYYLRISIVRKVCESICTQRTIFSRLQAGSGRQHD